MFRCIYDICGAGEWMILYAPLFVCMFCCIMRACCERKFQAFVGFCRILSAFVACRGVA